MKKFIKGRQTKENQILKNNIKLKSINSVILLTEADVFKRTKKNKTLLS